MGEQVGGTVADQIGSREEGRFDSSGARKSRLAHISLGILCRGSNAGYSFCDSHAASRSQLADAQ